MPSGLQELWYPGGRTVSQCLPLFILQKSLFLLLLYSSYRMMTPNSSQLEQDWASIIMYQVYCGNGLTCFQLSSCEFPCKFLGWHLLNPCFKCFHVANWKQTVSKKQQQQQKMITVVDTYIHPMRQIHQLANVPWRNDSGGQIMCPHRNEDASWCLQTYGGLIHLYLHFGDNLSV